MSTNSKKTTNLKDVIKQLIARFTKLKRQNQGLLNKQNKLIKTLNQQKANQPTKRASIPKFLKPELYNGYKGNVKNFLTQAKAYLKVNKRAITNLKAKILYINNLLTKKAIK